MTARFIPDNQNSGAFTLICGNTVQSWVDPARPDHLEFEYTQQLADFLACTVLKQNENTRVRVVHIGGGALSLPRWVAWKRPRTAQIVCEPDSDLVNQVRIKVPLPKFSGIKIREIDGLAGVHAMPAQWADAVVIDAFNDDKVPGELATSQFFIEIKRVLRTSGIVAMNLGDRAPFGWSKRCLASAKQNFKYLLFGAEPATLKGRRFGNLVFMAANHQLPSNELEKLALRRSFGYRIIYGKQASSFIGAAEPFTTPVSSPGAGEKGWFRY